MSFRVAVDEFLGFCVAERQLSENTLCAYAADLADLAHPFGRIPCASLKIQRDKAFTLLTNDMERSALALAELYKARWRIELLFRWIKQHLKIRKFLGNNDNAIRLQLFAAMIAYALLRIAA